MTSKERWMAALRLQTVDRLPFWSKIIDESYAKSQAQPFSKMNTNDMHKWLGDDSLIWLPSFIKCIRTNTAVDIEKDGDVERTIYQTNSGRLESVMKFDIPSHSWHPVKMAIESVEDVKVMTQWFMDCRAEIDREKLEEVRLVYKDTGFSAATTSEAGTSPLMYFLEMLAGVENAHYLLADCTEEVEELFNAMHNVNMRKMEILCDKSPADFVLLVENTSTALISPKQYHDYCFKHIQQYGDIVENSGHLLVLHMCGHLKAVLPDLAKVRAAAFEAFTSPTLGNTTLLEGRSACPDKCLIGGTNAVLWMEPAEIIIERLEEYLNVLPHHRGLVISPAGIMTPLCMPETIKEVFEWIKNYKIRV